MIDYLVNVVSCLTINLILFKQLPERYERRKNKRIFIMLFSFITLITALINTYNIPMINTVITLAGFLLIKTTMFNAGLFENIGRDIITFLILVLLDSLCFFIIGFIYTDPVTIVYFRPLTSSVMVLFLSTVLFKKFHYSKIEKVPKYEMLLFFLITGFSVILIYIFSLNYSLIEVEHKLLVSLIIVSILIVDIIVFHYLEYVNKSYEMKEKIIHEESKMQMMNQYYHNMKLDYLNTRELIHDFKNHMYTMSLAYEQNKKNIAENIMKQFNEECDKNKITFMTGSDILDIILSDKNSRAKKLNVKFDFKMDDIDLSWIKEFDMITIFGNLLDNALEANQELDEGFERYIEIRIYQKYSMVMIKIINSCQNQLVESNQKYQTTKEGHSGVGLQSVQKATEAYDGVFEIEINGMKCEAIVCLVM